MNLQVIIGRVCNEPVYGNGNGVSYLRFDVAVDRPDNKEETDFFHCVVFGKTADIMSAYLKKGRLVAVTGRNLSSNRVRGEFKVKEWTLYGDKIELLDRAPAQQMEAPQDDDKLFK